MSRPPARLGARLLGRLIAGYVRLVRSTGRWRVEIDPATRRLAEDGEPLVGACWHGRLALFPTELLGREWTTMISRSKDGDIAAAATEAFGIQVVRGSPKSGGGTAHRALIAALRDGRGVSLTPDGPKGPARRVKPGLIHLMRETRAPVAPFAFSAGPARRVQGWDGFLLPFPFARGVILIGAPMPYDPGLSDADHAGRIAKSLDALVARADAVVARRAGRPFSPAHLAYRLGTAMARPFAGPWLARRARRGKEDPARLGERFGRTRAVRPHGRILWLHAASVGESLALLPLVDRALETHDDLQIVWTTQTVTAARIVKDRAGARVIHQFAPLDHPAFLNRFLDHWRPCAAWIAESELWPHMLDALCERAVPVALLNARMSGKSAAGWKRAPRMAARMTAAFDLITATDAANAARLTAMGAEGVHVTGNLKAAAPAPQADAAALQSLRAMTAGRPLWLAASTHEADEAVIAAAHRALSRERPDLLLILAPRHPERGGDIAERLAATGFTVARRSPGERPRAETTVYLADTLGELDLLYAHADIAAVGGAWATRGGQNPLEPARAGCAVLTGPHTENFAEIYADLIAAGAARRADGADALAAETARLLSDPDACAAMGRAGRDVAAAKAHVLDDVWALVARTLASRNATP